MFSTEYSRITLATLSRGNRLASTGGGGQPSEEKTNTSSHVTILFYLTLRQNCHLTVKKLPKIKKKLPKIFIFCQFKKKVNLGQFFDSQMAIFRRVSITDITVIKYQLNTHPSQLQISFILILTMKIVIDLFYFLNIKQSNKELTE